MGDLWVENLENLEEAVYRTRRLRREVVEARNEAKEADKAFVVGDLVLIWDAQKAVDMSSDMKWKQRWVGPYKVREANAEKGYYRLKDLHGAPFASTVMVDRLKRFKILASTVAHEILRGRLKLYL
ncbi:hypothetical protein PtrM4_115760 [Pyrenophora tritici-repentis]|uniref:Uncharacterized protein n=1 Tax=Pyrenophora tritici-repentis TaxID=45151 RepID=A0A834RSR2_9PLEO|nr:hypothetical protein PtrM4_115760 [Pyrenophora tritici-repentis]